MREILEIINKYLSDNKINLIESVVIPYDNKYHYAEKVTIIQDKKCKIVVLHDTITVKVLEV